MTTPASSVLDESYAIRLDELLPALEQQIRGGNFEPSRAVLDEVTRTIGPHAIVEHLQAQIDLLSGRSAAAIVRARASIDLDPRVPQAWYTLGRAWRASGQVEQAIAAYRRALALDPGLAPVHISLGIAQRLAGDLHSAVGSYRTALRLAPGSPEAHRNLANALLQLGEDAQANLHVSRGNEELRREATALALAGLEQLDGRDFTAAAATYRRLAELVPGSAPAWCNLGNALQNLDRLVEAAECYERAVALDPSLVAALNNLGNVQMHLGRFQSMVESFDRALAVQGIDGLRVRAALALPTIPADVAEIMQARTRLEQRVDALLAEPPTLVAPQEEADATTFYLSYHGLDNRILQQKVARMHLAACPSLAWRAPHVDRPCAPGGRRIRVGFLSRFMHAHSIGRTTVGLVEQLDRARFEVITLHLPPVMDDPLALRIRGSADRAIDLPRGLADARSAIAGLELDVLFYQDIGMESTSYFLAFARLAHVQCMSFGHPETSGVPNMDWFVSSDLYETPGSEEHYSERLHLLRGAGTLAYYQRPELIVAPSRALFGLPPEGGANVYLCPQTLFKFHPEFDAILGGILEADPDGMLVLLEAKLSTWGSLLRTRLSRVLGPAAMERVRFLPQQGTPEFLALIACADVMLDTVHFNGMNTSLEAFSVGTPVVTWPRAFQRGRHTAGMYRRMGLEELIADSAQGYVDRAVRLGRDPAWRARMRDAILSRCAVLYEDSGVVRQFEAFFIEALHACATECTGP